MGTMTGLLARLLRRHPPGVVRLGPFDWRITCSRRHTMWLRFHALPPPRTDWACPRCGEPCALDPTPPEG